MTMTVQELEKAMRGLRLSGMVDTLQARSLQVASHEMSFIEALSALVQDELDRRRSRLLDRRFGTSGLAQRLTLKSLDWTYNPRLPKRDILELGTLKFVDEKEDVLLIGAPGTGKSHVAKSLAMLAVDRGYKVLYREARTLLEEIHQSRQLGTMPRYRAQLASTELLIIDDLFLQRLPTGAADELADVLMGRYEKRSTIITSNRPIDDWAELLGDTVIVGPLLDRLMHHGHLLRFEGKSWRLKEAAERSARSHGSD